MLLGKGARGELVKRVQQALGATPDGVYGAGTAAAVKAAQTKAKLLATGNIESADQWRALVDMSPPSLFDRCLNLTAAFEGHGYGKVAGNWDGAGLTWGIIGFTLKSGSLGSVLQNIPFDVLVSAFDQEPAAHALMLATKLAQAERVAWGDSISVAKSKPPKHQVISPWAERFASLATYEETKAAQRKIAHDLYWMPSQLSSASQLSWMQSERFAAMCFDCHVQQGRVFSLAITAAKQAAPEGEVAALEAIAKAQAQGRYADDILARRMTIATGKGTVHGRVYDLAAYGLAGPHA